MNIEGNLVFKKERLIENIDFINELFHKNEMSWTFVIKAFNSYSDSFIENLADLPCTSIASDKESHLELIKIQNPTMETWYLNYQGVELTNNCIDVNLTHAENSNIQNTCFMLSIDPEREGIEYNPEKTGFSKVGAYLNCETPPNPSLFDAWKNLNIPPEITQSLGTSITYESLDLLKSKGANHYRLGEIILTGKSLIDGSKINGLRQDVFEPQHQVSYHLISQLYL
jgi:hypothetical protein